MEQERNNPYYDRGAYLRIKHQQTRFDSGRQFHKWALRLVPLSSSAKVLDAGCGWGRFTWYLIEEREIPPANIVWVDRAKNMLDIALAEAHQKNKPIKPCLSDAEALPFQSSRFDVIMANHMLYHLQDIRAGLRELGRVMKQDGYFLATTNSEKIRVTIIELHYEALANLGVAFEPEPPSPFSMENGQEYLTETFYNVKAFYFEDSSVYHNPDDFVKLYLATGRYRNFIARKDISPQLKAKLPKVYEQLVQDIIAQEGQLVVPALMGAFVCSKPKLMVNLGEKKWN